MDRVSKEVRSANMRAIKDRNTKPEIQVRSIVHSLGYRFRLHRSDLPGTPDLVFPSRNKVLFVHGCYWHGHGCRRGGAGAKSNQGYWGPKLERTKARDKAHLIALEELGWDAMIVWECEIDDQLPPKLKKFLR